MTVNTLDANDSERAPRPAAAWVWPLLPIAGSMFCLSALLYYHLRHDVIEVRSALQVAVAGLYQMLGFAPAFLLFLLVLTWSSIWFVTGRLERPWARIGRLLAMAVMLGVFMNLGDGRVTADFHKGELGAWLASRLVDAFGYYPSLALVWAVTFAALLLATDFFFIDSFDPLRGARRAAAVEPETGVEPQVTDHLRGLATSLRNAPAVAPAAGPLRPAGLAGAEAPADALGPAPDHGDVEVEPAVEEPIVEPPLRRRRSRFDRWDDAAAPAADAGAAAAAEDVSAWVPAPPDNQEIDNPEHALASEAAAGEPAATAEFGATAEFQEAELREIELQEAAAPGEAVAPDEAVAPEDAWASGAAAAPSELVEPADAALADWREPAAPAAASEAPFAAALPPADGAPVAPEAPAPEIAAAAGFAAEPLPAPAAAVPPAAEPIVTIPRPPAPAEPARQQVLFGGDVDEALVQEAIEVVTGSRRASAAFLQRKLRIDYGQACRVLVALAARGIVELEADASQGRVVG